MSTFADRLIRVDEQVEKRILGFRNLESEALSAIIDYAVYCYHMANREVGLMQLSSTFAEGVVQLRVRMAVYEELGTIASEMMKAKRKPERGLNGPEDDDD